MEKHFKHTPVLLKEVIEALNIKGDGVYVDGTFGGGGHSSKILENLKSGKLIAIDKDDDALTFGKKKFSASNNIQFIKSDFKYIINILDELNINKIDGVLLDLGVSSYQLDTAERGFSFRYDAELDMRMDQTKNLDAYKVLNNYDESKLVKIFFEFGEEPKSRKIAKAIIKNRKTNPIKTTKQLVDIITSVVPFNNLTTLARIFQAIRIEVNAELTGLETCLKEMVSRLNIGGRLAVITFHSLEDRIVKKTFKLLAQKCTCDKRIPICICNGKSEIIIINKKPIIPSETEIKLNARSSSAKLRVVEKI